MGSTVEKTCKGLIPMESSQIIFDIVLIWLADWLGILIFLSSSKTRTWRHYKALEKTMSLSSHKPRSHSPHTRLINILSPPAQTYWKLNITGEKSLPQLLSLLCHLNLTISFRILNTSHCHQNCSISLLPRYYTTPGKSWSYGKGFLAVSCCMSPLKLLKDGRAELLTEIWERIG
jgi:hypothetical protein